MIKPTLALLALAFLALPSLARAQDDEAAEDTAPEADAAETGEEAPPPEPGGPKVMSGMSILGNEEAPKSLVIIPWKSSEIGADLGLADGLDDSARPVDKEVFLRELAFYRIRSGK